MIETIDIATSATKIVPPIIAPALLAAISARPTGPNLIFEAASPGSSIGI